MDEMSERRSESESPFIDIELQFTIDEGGGDYISVQIEEYKGPTRAEPEPASAEPTRAEPEPASAELAQQIAQQQMAQQQQIAFEEQQQQTYLMHQHYLHQLYMQQQAGAQQAGAQQAGAQQAGMMMMSPTGDVQRRRRNAEDYIEANLQSKLKKQELLNVGQSVVEGRQFRGKDGSYGNK